MIYGYLDFSQNDMNICCLNKGWKVTGRVDVNLANKIIQNSYVRKVRKRSFCVDFVTICRYMNLSKICMKILTPFWVWIVAGRVEKTNDSVTKWFVYNSP
jgi:hypothetical protein